MIKRVFLIVLDSYGIGNAPDAEAFHDGGANTLQSIVGSDKYDTEWMKKMGLFNIDGVTCKEGVDKTIGAYGRLTEASMGKDTTIGHWEIAGIVSKNPLPTYPNGFPEDVLKEFSKKTGRGVLCNLPYSGTDVIRDYGRQHMETGDLIVYTSADSVFQIAAHEDVVPVDELYRYCEIARRMLQGKHGVGRVIARPFVGTEGNFTRTPRRHDYSLKPQAVTMMDVLLKNGLDTYGVGKIYDIFAGKGIAHTVRIEDNVDGMEKTLQWQKTEDFKGLCFVNLVDFDMKYGHRRDIDGYANAATVFDGQLHTFIDNMKEDDVLMITADHGCDPGFAGTDHTRECVPLLVYGHSIKENVNLGTRKSFADIAATIQEMFGLTVETSGESFWGEILKGKHEPNNMEAEAQMLLAEAKKARENAYAPYSNFWVGAALLLKSGEIVTGCNVENAAFTPGNCAERTAFFKAISEGKRDFEAIAIVGGKQDSVDMMETEAQKNPVDMATEKGPAPAGAAKTEKNPAPADNVKVESKPDSEAATDEEHGQTAPAFCGPCGVCRQVMREFCDEKTFRIYVTDGSNVRMYLLKELLPLSFGPDNLS